MDEDFGTPEAIAVLFDLASEINRSRSAALSGQLQALGACLGLLQLNPAEFLKGRRGESAAQGETQEIDRLVSERSKAKAERDFALADRIRQNLYDRGVVLKDAASGTSWERVR